MSGWLARWGVTVWMWASCAAALAGDLGAGHLTRWQGAAWIIYVAAWVGIARLKDSTIRTQKETISLLRRHRDFLWQRDKAGLS